MAVPVQLDVYQVAQVGGVSPPYWFIIVKLVEI